MQNARAFKKGLSWLILLMGALYGIYSLLQFSPLEQTVVKKVNVNNLVNLYITKADAGATTDFSYRFYLYDASKGDNAFTASLDDNNPFLVTSDKDALKQVDNGALYLSVKGTIYSFQSPASYIINDSIHSVPIYMRSSSY